MTVTVEHTRTELLLGDDPRFMAAVRCVLAYVARRAGLASEEEERLKRATEQVCEESFPLLNGAERVVGLVVEDFPGRIEVSVEHAGAALPSAGLDSFAGLGPAEEQGTRSGASLLAEVDRVQYETRDGRSRMILVKYTAKPARIN